MGRRGRKPELWHGLLRPNTVQSGRSSPHESTGSMFIAKKQAKLNTEVGVTRQSNDWPVSCRQLCKFPAGTVTNCRYVPLPIATQAGAHP
jgi:hypothetical protein